MKSKVFLLCFLVLLSSCWVSKFATFSVGLTSVEMPSNEKQQFSETKIVTLKDNGISKYRYEDDIIDITWFVESKLFSFTLKNKSDHAIKINWDDISYVDIIGNVGRVMHSGVKYSERNNSQPSTLIPKGASISDVLLPVNNVFFESGEYGRGWVESPLLPSRYKNQDEFDILSKAVVGKEMKILMPIIIENVQNDYTFVFNINNITPQK